MPSLEILLFLTDFILESAIRRSTTPLSENGILHHHSPNIQIIIFFLNTYSSTLATQTVATAKIMYKNSAFANIMINNK